MEYITCKRDLKKSERGGREAEAECGIIRALRMIDVIRLVTRRWIV